MVNFSCTQLSPEEKMINNTLGKTIEIEMFTMVQEGNRIIPFEEFRASYRFVSLAEISTFETPKPHTAAKRCCYMMKIIPVNPFYLHFIK